MLRLTSHPQLCEVLETVQAGSGLACVMYGTTNFYLRDGTVQLFLPFHLPTAVFSFLKVTYFWKEGGFTKFLPNYTKGNIGLSTRVLGKIQQLVGEFQANFEF